MSRIEGCLNETSGWLRAKYRVSFLALQQAEEGNKHTQKSSTVQRNYIWRKKKLKDNSWWRTFLTNWGRYTLRLTTPLTCASVRGIISWVFLMFHCLKKSCAFLKYHSNQETGKKTWLNNWCPLYKNVNALLMKCNTRATVGMIVSMEPWRINDRAFTVNFWEAMCTASKYPDVQFYIDD